jgi:fibronectin type 3 domain-containing protein
MAARAQLLVYEPFNYATGTFATGTAGTGTGESGNWTCGQSGTIVSGLTYTGLPVSNNALRSGGGRQFISFANPLSSGTAWVSFLYSASGNMGGNIDGVYFPNGGTGLYFGFGLAPYSGTQGGFGLGSMTTTGSSAMGATSLADSFLGTYGVTYMVAIEIQFNTSGNNDTVTVYLNPVAGASAPGVAATYTVSSFDVGTITGIGLNCQGGANITVDEIRVGDTYGDVAGYVAPPPAPTSLIATPGVNSVSLNWNAASGATGYFVLRGTSSGTYTVTNSTASTSYTDNTTAGGTTYYYVVEGTNSSGAGPKSNETNATPTIALPGPPSGLTATGTNGAVSLSWSSGTGASSYNVKRSTSSGHEVTITNVTATSYYDANVNNGTQYFYEVSSTNNAGESANSGEVSVTPNLPPSAPTGLAAVPGTNEVTLSWNSSAGAVSYNVKRSTSSGTEVTITNVTTTGYTDLSAVKFSTYYYTVSAVSGDGESANSSEVSTTVLGAYGPDAYESFNYPLGTLANNTPSTALGFTGNWTVSGSPSITTGLTYANLPSTNNAYQHSAAGSQTTENLAAPLSTGTKYISFLIKGSGDSGGDTVGVFFKGSNASSLFAGFYNPYSANQTGFGLGSVNSTDLGTATGLGSSQPIDNTAVHFIVIEINFNTSGANDTVSLWIDPPAGVTNPGVAPSEISSNYDVGTISAFGINITGGYSPIIDEIRIGDVYGDVSGYVPPSAPTIPTTLGLSVQQVEQVSWTANSSDSYQPQRSTDGSTWSNVGGVLQGSAVTSVYDSSPAPFYRVLDYTSGTGNAAYNGSFEILDSNYGTGASGWNNFGNGFDGNGNSINSYVTNQWGPVTPVNGTNLLYMEGITANPGVAGFNVEVDSDLFPIPNGGVNYPVTFSSCNPLNIGCNQQYEIGFYDSTGANISYSGWLAIGAGTGTTWQTISNNFAAPANAAYMTIYFLQACGAGSGWDNVTLIDNVQVLYTQPGTTNVLTPTTQSATVFAATVQTNAITAGNATGTVAFQVNSVAQSTGTVTGGTAYSAPATPPSSYTLTAIYSGDGTYLGTTNSLVVGGGISTTSTNIGTSFSGNQFTLKWPTDHTGWTLQSETNLMGNWQDVPGSTATDEVIITTSPAKPTVFYRLKYNP